MEASGVGCPLHDYAPAKWTNLATRIRRKGNILQIQAAKLHRETLVQGCVDEDPPMSSSSLDDVNRLIRELNR
ncbi:MAG TPA: hypothetical protein VFV54_04040, partial [Thermoanaerobaculia bacterium]|nr:hypothetical protein [Thermoanaerobaculia bacterium]